MNVRLCAPENLLPAEGLVADCEEISAHTGTRLTLTDDVSVGVKDVDVVYTDVWVSMGEPNAVWEERIRLLRPYQVNL